MLINFIHEIESPCLPQSLRQARSRLDTVTWWANRIAEPVMAVVGPLFWLAIIAFYVVAFFDRQL